MSKQHFAGGGKDPVLDEIVKRLVAEFQPTRVFLFGSRARGEGGPGSDYDLLLVMSVMKVPAHHLVQQAHRHALRGIPAPIDLVILTEKEFQARKSVIGSLPETAVHEGKEIYAA